MQELSNQMMGYDRTATMFSPDGRLLQVEYAKKTVKQGPTSIGLVCKDGVILVTDKRILDKFIVSSSVEKIMKVDDHIGATVVGLFMDGRVLVEKAQVIAQQHRVTYDTPIELHTLVKEICDIKQFYTQYGGARPFGVTLLFIGVNEESELFVTDPTGIYFKYNAIAVGENEGQVKKILEREYKETMDMEGGLKLAIKALKQVLGAEFDIKRIDAAYIGSKEKRFKRFDRSKLK